jgi:glutathione peroxidase
VSSSKKLPMKLFLTQMIFAASLVAAPLEQISFRTMDGKETSLSQYAGKVVLIVNVASHCGNTPQYAALEKLYRDHATEGLVILGFPCNDFGAQEPGSNDEIKAFCTSKYEVTFPMMDKIHVKGSDQSPLYAALTGPESKFPGDVRWNFGKFLIGRNGEVLARFEPSMKPDSPEVLAAINGALKASSHK